MDWRSIPGFPNYECTACGVVRSIGRQVRNRNGYGYRAEKIMSPTLNRYSKTRYCLGTEDGFTKTISPQRITWITWVGTIPDGHGVVLVDNSKPASVDNLELMWRGHRVIAEAHKPARKTPSPYKLEGFCKLMANFLRMRYEC